MGVLCLLEILNEAVVAVRAGLALGIQAMVRLTVVRAQLQVMLAVLAVATHFIAAGSLSPVPVGVSVVVNDPTVVGAVANISISPVSSIKR